jgi:hypothetical protein
MCSTPSERLARIGEAIDKLAADSRAPDPAGPDPAGPGPAGVDGGIQDRLARIWAMVAELDPDLARRVTDFGPGTGR